LILTHHWFYGYDPVANRLLRLLWQSRAREEKPPEEKTPNVEICSNPFLFGTEPVPEIAPEPEAVSPKELFNTLCEDLEDLIRFARRGTGAATGLAEVIRTTTATVLSVLTGQIYWGDFPKDSHTHTALCSLYTRDVSLPHRAGFFLVNTCLINEVEPISLRMPVIQAETAREKARANPTQLASLVGCMSPCCEEMTKGKGGASGDFVSLVKQVKRQSNGSSLQAEKTPMPKDDGSESGRWFRELVRHRVYEEYLALPQTSNAARAGRG
jgi:hypothetical protein